VGILFLTLMIAGLPDIVMTDARVAMPEVAAQMNALPTIVFPRTLASAEG
jgi:hypothetical protein